MIPQSSTDDRQVIRGGVVSGLVAGGLLTVMMTVMSALNGNDVWFGMKGTAAPFLGEQALTPGFDWFAVPFGLALHLLISVGWALAFASLFYGISKKMTIVAGLGWGLVVWLGMYYVVLPLVGLGAMREGAPLAQVILYHVFFGLVVALAFLPFQRRERFAQARGRLLTV